MYNYDHDCPFEAYITNLGKYNEGALVGEWVKFPTTYEIMQEVFQRIGIDGIRYEEWFITDYDCYVNGIYDVLGEYESLDELNYLAASIEAMDKDDFSRFEAAIGVSDYSNSVKDLINLTENLDKYDIYPDVHDHEDLGRLYLEEYSSLEIPDHLKNYIDYEAYGRDVALDEIGHFTDQGYVRDTGDSFYEHYDGNRENIPEEYRVMSKPEDLELSEDEKLDMAQDLAFDLDEFFRQKDPQYAAAHPDEHAGKELIADLLLEGKTAAIKDRLSEMAQLPEGELVSRIGSYERATGYEAYLDTDVAAIRDKLEQAQEHEDTMTVLVVEPMKEPYIKEIAPGLAAMQTEIDGRIEATYPYDDPVALICNDEGKMNGMELNRALRDDRGEIYDIMAGTFLVTGLGDENFASLSPELVEKYMEHFRTPEMFAMINGELVAVPIPAEAREPELIVPDDVLTGERIETPRGSFSVVDMTKEQAQAAGYGYHHSSDDDRYHIVGNGTRAFAIVNEAAPTYEIYQLKDSPDRRDYAFEPLDRLHERGRTVDMQNYDKVYSGVMGPGENLESIYTRFNVDHPQDFTGHSLSVSDVVVIHQNGRDAAHYCDSFGFTQAPEFFQIQTRAASHSNYKDMVALIGADGNVYLGKSENYHFVSAVVMPWHNPSQEYGDTASHYDNSDQSLIFISDNPKMFHFISGDGWVKSQADMLNEELFTQEDYSEFARVQAEVVNNLPFRDNFDGIRFAGQPFTAEPENYLKNAEMAAEDDYGMIDGIINNGPKEVAPPRWG